MERYEQGHLDEACEALLSCAYLNHQDDTPFSLEMLKGACALAHCFQQKGMPDQAVTTLEQAVAKTQVAPSRHYVGQL